MPRRSTHRQRRALGRKLIVVHAGTESDLDAAFAAIVQRRVGALLMQADPFFNSRRDQVVALAAKHAVPALSPYLDYAPAGGLLSYGTSIADALRLVGNYAGFSRAKGPPTCRCNRQSKSSLSST
jgi:putative tryptophan/tyrosine transport system substrate-binding protein